MSRVEQTGAGTWLALVAGYLLVIQLVFAGYASGLQAAPDTSDVFAHVLCTASGLDVHSDIPGRGTAHHGVPTCCLSGCSMFAVADLPTPSVQGRASEAARPTTVIAVGPVSASFRYDPRHTRAPPFSV